MRTFLMSILLFLFACRVVIYMHIWESPPLFSGANMHLARASAHLNTRLKVKTREGDGQLKNYKQTNSINQSECPARISTNLNVWHQYQAV